MTPCAERLIIFTRYPQPGQTKTRLIPALGAEGAADLQRQMSEHMLKQARALCQQRSLETEVQFAGGDRTLMKTWLGEDLNYQPQATGDLGQRMVGAFRKAFEQGKQRVVIIGIDCPGINPAILTQAFEHLKQRPLVLGPALDGGYYLIGLSEPCPALFVGVDWGTGQVLKQTQEIATQQGIQPVLLPALGDVDRPEDLAIWEAFAVPE